MAQEKQSDEWLYVFVCNPGPKESYFGLINEESEVNFIPAFQNKDEANDCFLELPRKKGVKYELQAVHVDDLYVAAKKNGFTVALVDKEGKIIKEQSLG